MNDDDGNLLAEMEGAINGAVDASPAAHGMEWWSTTNAATMCALVLLFGVFVMSLSTWLLKQGRSANDVLRVFGTVLVIMSTTFLVVAGYSERQITAPIGLLGTIAGYLLGRDSDKGDRSA